MKKLTKTTLSQMAALLPELDEEDQRSILGGTASTTIPPNYTGNVPASTAMAVTGAIPYGVTGNYPTSTTAPTGASQAPTGYTFDEMDWMIENGTWGGGYVDGMGYVGEAALVTGAFVSGSTTTSADSSCWDDVCDYCSSVKDAAVSLVPDAVTVNVSFDFAFIGGGGYDAGYALVLKGPDAGNVYSYDTYNSMWGAHAEASVNMGFCYYTGKDDEMNFKKVFGGEGGGLEIDALGGVSGGSSAKDNLGHYLIMVNIGAGASAGAGLNWGHTNVREVW